MPEGPEIRRAADQVAEVLEGECAREVFFAFDRLARFVPLLEGLTVSRVETRGKAMLTWFDDAWAVYSHNQLYGKWMVRKTQRPPTTDRSLRFSVKTGKGGAYLFSASEIAVLEGPAVETHPFLEKLGPDPLRAEVSVDDVYSHLESPRFRRKKLATLMLEQSFIAGVGNYLRSEILFVAGIHPDAALGQLESGDRERLGRAICDITARSYATGGITNAPEIAERLEKEGVPRKGLRHFVFGREGHTCHLCNTQILMRTTGGRRLFFCPTCQAP